MPWQGVRVDDVRKRYQIIGNIKEETRIAELGNRYPWEFSLYLRYCRTLKFSQTPDYGYLKNLFRSCLNRIGGQEDHVYDWMVSPKKLQRPIEEQPTEEYDISNDGEEKLEEAEGCCEYLEPVVKVKNNQSNESMVLSGKSDWSNIIPGGSNEEVRLLRRFSKQQIGRFTSEKDILGRPDPKGKPVATIEPFEYKEQASKGKKSEEEVKREETPRPRDTSPSPQTGARPKETGVAARVASPAPVARIRPPHVELVRFDSCCSFLRVAKNLRTKQT